MHRQLEYRSVEDISVVSLIPRKPSGSSIRMARARRIGQMPYRTSSSAIGLSRSECEAGWAREVADGCVLPGRGVRESAGDRATQMLFAGRSGRSARSTGSQLPTHRRLIKRVPRTRRLRRRVAAGPQGPSWPFRAHEGPGPSGRLVPLSPARQARWLRTQAPTGTAPTMSAGTKETSPARSGWRGLTGV